MNDPYLGFGVKDKNGIELKVGDTVKWELGSGAITTHKLMLRPWKSPDGKKIKRVQLEAGLWLTPDTAQRIEKVERPALR